jgi:Flp pilus assembly protein TadG
LINIRPHRVTGFSRCCTHRLVVSSAARKKGIVMRRRFIRSRGRRGASSGSVAVEFALIAPIFFLLLFGIIETTLALFASMTLENGMKTVARLIRTGQVQGQNMSQAQFRQVLCDQIDVVLSCDPARLYIDVRSFANFASLAFPAPINAQGNLNANLNSYQIGASSQNTAANSIVLVRAFYTWPMFTPLLGQFYANMQNNTRLLTASAAFRNEPF